MFSQMILHVIKPAIPVQFHFHLLPGLRKLRTLRDLQFMKYFTLSFLDAHYWESSRRAQITGLPAGFRSKNRRGENRRSILYPDQFCVPLPQIRVFLIDLFCHLFSSRLLFTLLFKPAISPFERGAGTERC